VSHEEFNSPYDQKIEEISRLKTDIKVSLLKYISNYFEGFFVNLWKNQDNAKFVPSIDVYSLTFPTNSNELLLKWFEDSNNHGFLHLLSISTWRYDLFKIKGGNHAVIGKGDQWQTIRNYFILTHKEIRGFNSYDCLYGLIGIERFLTQQEIIFSDINSTLLKEIKNLKENKLDDLIKSREDIFKKIFTFERFKTEINLYFEQRVEYFCEFCSIVNKQEFKAGYKCSKDEEFFHLIEKNMRYRLDIIDNYVKTYYKQSNNNLTLKNVKYSKNIQRNLIWFTILIFILTVIQAYLAYKKG